MKTWNQMVFFGVFLDCTHIAKLAPMDILAIREIFAPEDFPSNIEERWGVWIWIWNRAKGQISYFYVSYCKGRSSEETARPNARISVKTVPMLGSDVYHT